MNREMAATFGHAPVDPEMVKEASFRDAFTKLAADEGIDLSALPDIDVANEYTAFRNQLKLAELQQAKFTEFERVGRAMARHWFYKAAAEAEAAVPHINDLMSQIDEVGDPATQDVLRGQAQDWWKREGMAAHVQAQGAKRVADATAAASKETALLNQLSGAAKPGAGGGLLAKYGPGGLGEALSKGNWGTALRKIAPIGAAVMGGKWLLDRRREKELAGQQASMGASPAVSMAGV